MAHYFSFITLITTIIWPICQFNNVKNLCNKYLYPVVEPIEDIFKSHNRIFGETT